jgi:hypothetical protein
MRRKRGETTRGGGGGGGGGGRYDTRRRKIRHEEEEDRGTHGQAERNKFDDTGSTTRRRVRHGGDGFDKETGLRTALGQTTGI